MIAIVCSSRSRFTIVDHCRGTVYATTTARAGNMDAARQTFEQVSPVAHGTIDYLRQQRAAMTEG